jgi:hypothetical protein
MGRLPGTSPDFDTSEEVRGAGGFPLEKLTLKNPLLWTHCGTLRPYQWLAFERSLTW